MRHPHLMHEDHLRIKETLDGLKDQPTSEREFFCYWLARVYEAGHRDTSYEEGETLDEVLRQINQVLGFAGYEPEQGARESLLKKDFAWIFYASTPTTSAAIEAAKEWFQQTRQAIEDERSRTSESFTEAAIANLDAAEQKLAAIITKHLAK